MYHICIQAGSAVSVHYKQCTLHAHTVELTHCQHSWDVKKCPHYAVKCSHLMFASYSFLRMYFSKVPRWPAFTLKNCPPLRDALKRKSVDIQVHQQTGYYKRN